MAIASFTRFSVLLLALLCLTGAHASRSLVDNNVNEKNDDSMKKTMTVDQKCGSGGGGCGGRPTCPIQGPGNCQGQCSGNCQCQGNCQGSGNCAGQCQGSGNCAGQCQGSYSGCVSCSSGCVQYVPICQVPCACPRGNSGYAYVNDQSKKIEGPHWTHVGVFPTNGAMTHRTNMINTAVNNDAHVMKPIDESPREVTNEKKVTSEVNMAHIVKPKTQSLSETTNDEMTRQVNMGHIVKPKNQSPSETTNEDMTRQVNMAHIVKPKSQRSPSETTNEEMTREINMGHIVKPKNQRSPSETTNEEMTREAIMAHIVKPKNQSPSKTTNEDMTRQANMAQSPSEITNEEMTRKANMADTHMVVPTNGAMTNGGNMGNNGVHNQVTNGEPMNPSMAKNEEEH